MKEIRFECPHCDQVIETPASMGGRPVECPSCCKEFMAPRRKRRGPSVIFVLALGLMGWFAWGAWNGVREMNQNSEQVMGKQESSSDRQLRMRQQAMEGISNVVYKARPGVTRIVSIDLNDFSARPADWRATAAVDYVNERGGIQRTNVYIRFGAAIYGNIYCLEDSEKLFEIWKKSLSDTR